MKKTCQVKFDERKRQLTVTFIINDVRQTMTLSYDDIRNGKVPQLSGTRASRLSYDEFKTVASELGQRFRLDPKVNLSPSQQFCLVLGHVANVLHPSNGQGILISDAQLRSLKVDVRMAVQDMYKLAGTTHQEFKEAVTCGYCAGVDSMFCTDDFIAIRQGNKIVARVNISGNDYNDLKNFLTHGSDRILSLDNIEQLRSGIRQMKLDSALELAERKSPTMKPGGIKITDK